MNGKSKHFHDKKINTALFFKIDTSTDKKYINIFVIAILKCTYIFNIN